MSAITTHVLDTSRGRPAAGVRVLLEWIDQRDQWQIVGRGVTDNEGRLRTLLGEAGPLAPGVYRLVFATQAYFEAHGVHTFFPHVTVTFEVVEGEPHYHVPLLVSPYGYSTYRGT